MFPDPARDSVNPYQSLLAGALREAGSTVRGVSLRRLRRGSVLHVHWPEMPLHDPDTGRMLKRFGRLAAQVLLARVRGVPVVWTVHNLRAHDGARPGLQKLLWATFPRLVDGWISLSRTGVAAARAEFPALRRARSIVVHHGDYHSVTTRPDRAAARRDLDLDTPGPVLAMVGRVKPYKGVEELVRAFAELPDPDARLVVAGGCEDPGLRGRLEAAAAADPRFRPVLRRVPQEQLDAVLAAADLVVLPFASVFNSGSLLLCLSAGRRVLAPRTDVFAETAAEVGEAWLRLFDGPLGAGTLRAALAEPPATGAPDLHDHDWSRIAAEHRGFYAELAAARSR